MLTRSDASQVVGDKSDDTRKLFKTQGVQSVPTIHFFKNGERCSEVKGPMLSTMDLIQELEKIRWP